ncbi:unnamed protein product [Ascophyllum nodosum]
MSVYLGALLTDWFQAAYLFVLLREYHPERFVVRMYLAGVVSQLSLSVLLEVMGGFISHKWRCAGCLVLQAASALLLLHPAFGGLVTSRVLGGFACSLLHSSFEAWMVEQHVGQGFPLDWFTHTFNRLSVAMSFLAVTLGPAVMAAHDFAGGNLGPFKISLILTVISALFLLSWRRDTNKPCPACADTGRLLSLAASALTAGDKVALISAAQGCFEAASFAFSMLWTPLITSVAKDVEELPWGLAFSQQLVCVMIGSALFKLVTALSPGTTAERMCVVASAGGAFCFFTIAMGPTLSGMQCALLGFEICAGIYLNAMGVMRSKYIPQEVRGLVLGTSKLIITTALFVLLLYFSEVRSLATGVCGVLLTAAAVLTLRASSSAGDDGGDEESAALAQRR